MPFVTEEERSERWEVSSWEEGEERRRRVRKEVYQWRGEGWDGGSRREGWTAGVSEGGRDGERGLTEGGGGEAEEGGVVGYAGWG